VSVDISGVQTQLQQFARDKADALGAEFVRRAQARAPRRSGAMADAVTYEVVDGGNGPEVRVRCDAEYARWQDEGTGIYGPQGTPIVPRQARVLAWEGQDGMVFAMSSRGSPATRWWALTLREWPDIVRAVAG